ncbi:MAG: sugar ABC transporter permease [Neomegalonema sp.]|nr:sugar ABC transporter permease [Neomegalonema sp.]
MADATLANAEGAAAPSAVAFIKKHMREYGILVAFLAIFSFFAIATGGDLLRPFNLTKVIEQQSFIIVMSVGMLMVIVSGHIDLSVGSVLGFIGGLAAVLISSGLDYRITIVVCLAAGALIGAMQGFWIAYFKIPSFIVTLAGMLVFKGLTLGILSGSSIGLPAEFKSLTTTFVPDLFGDFGKTVLGKDGIGLHPYSRFNTLSLLAGIVCAALIAFSAAYSRKLKAKRGVVDEPFSLFVIKTSLICFAVVGFGYLLAGWKGLPNILILMALVVGVYHFITQHTTVGRRVYAVGGNEKAAKLSGINSERLTFLVFANMGFLAALGGLIYAARFGVAEPKAGETLELDIIAAVFIGGASMSGGVGTVIGAVIGALIMGVMNNGMLLLGVEIQWQQVIKGALLLAAVIFDVLNKKKAT